MSAKKPKPAAVKVKPYEASPREEAAVQSLYARHEKQKPVPRMKVSKRGIEPDHPDGQTGAALLLEALGTVEHDFMAGLLGQLAKAGTQTGDTTVEAVEDRLNFMLAMVTGMEPKDQVETMLLSQMAAVHNATMIFARRLNHADSFMETECAERPFNKLARTFAVQVETLKRYRTGGEQRVTVEHVTVAEGAEGVVLPFRRKGVGGVQAGVGG